MENYKIVDEAITSRKAVRGYLPQIVPKNTIEEILEVAKRAPSGNNCQPWHIIVLTGKPLQEFTESLTAEVENAFKNGGVTDKSHPYEYQYYPQQWIEPFLSRRRKVGLDLYAAMSITKEDKLGRQKQFIDNFRFFGAPVGMFILMNRSMGSGGLLDTGMFIENICIAARARGLDTCPQAVFSSFYKTIYQLLNISPELMMLCGLALGYADKNHQANSLITERAQVKDFADFRGF